MNNHSNFPAFISLSKNKYISPKSKGRKIQSVLHKSTIKYFNYLVEIPMLHSTTNAYFLLSSSFTISNINNNELLFLYETR